MASFAVAPPAAHGAAGQIIIDRHDVHPGVTEEPVDDILSSGPQPSLDDHTQLDPDRGGHEADKRIFKMTGKFAAARLAKNDRYGS